MDDKKIDISTAGLKEAENVSEILISEEEKNSEEFAKNLQDVKEIKLSEVGKSDNDETVTINFLDEAQVNNFTQSEAKKSENKANKGFSYEGKSVEDIQKQIKQEEEQSKKIEPETFVEVARFIIFLIDALMSAGLRWFAKDNIDTPYSLNKTKQEQLVKQLSNILIKYQAKFSIEWMFLISIIVLYIPGFIAAKSKRKDFKEEPVVPKKQTVVKQEPIQQPVYKEYVSPSVSEIEVHNPIVMDNVNEIVEEAVVKTKKPTRRGKGGVRKL